jgi:hypothetical protein
MKGVDGLMLIIAGRVVLVWPYHLLFLANVGTKKIDNARRYRSATSMHS